jgi:prevent-host-death family protein
VRTVALSAIKDDFSRYLREDEKQEIVITRHGKPAGVLVGFKSEDDWFDFRLETDPRFLRRIEKARASLRAGWALDWRISAKSDRAPGRGGGTWLPIQEH